MFLKGLLNKKIFYRCVAEGDEGDEGDKEDEGAEEKYYSPLPHSQFPRSASSF